MKENISCKQYQDANTGKHSPNNVVSCDNIVYFLENMLSLYIINTHTHMKKCNQNIMTSGIALK